MGIIIEDDHRELRKHTDEIRSAALRRGSERSGIDFLDPIAVVRSHPGEAAVVVGAVTVAVGLGFAALGRGLVRARAPWARWLLGGVTLGFAAMPFVKRFLAVRSFRAAHAEIDMPRADEREPVLVPPDVDAFTTNRKR